MNNVIIGGNPVRHSLMNETQRLLKELITAQNQQDAVIRNLTRQLLQHFFQAYEVFECIIECVVILDCLTSLAISFSC